MDDIKTLFLRWDRGRKQKDYDALLSAVWETYHPKLQSYASQFYAGDLEITDLVSEILLKIFEELPRYRSEYSFSTWLYTLARNRMIDRMRKKQPALYAINDALSENERTPEEIQMVEIERELIQKAVQTLNGSDRELVFLYFYEEMKYQEMALVLKIPQGTIKSRMFEIRKKLKNQLEGDFGER